MVGARMSRRARRLFKKIQRADSKYALQEIASGIQTEVDKRQLSYDEALMLDPHGHVATCNSTHFFIVRDGEVWTSSGDYCLDGITRRNVINVCKANGIPVYEKNFSLMQVYGADEAFVTGTFAGLTPVFEVDGRTMTHTQRGPMVDRLQALYQELVVSESALPENCSR